MKLYCVCRVFPLRLPLPGTPGRGRGRGAADAEVKMEEGGPLDFAFFYIPLGPLSPTRSPEYRGEGVTCLPVSGGASLPGRSFSCDNARTHHATPNPNH